MFCAEQRKIMAVCYIILCVYTSLPLRKCTKRCSGNGCSEGTC